MKGISMALLMGAFAAAHSAVAQTPTGTLRVRIECARSGPLYLIVVNEKNFKDTKKGVANALIIIDDKMAEKGECIHEIRDLPHGVYGIKAFLDANGNGKMDTGIFGIPTEPWGMSWNGKKPMTRAPRFEEIAFTFDGDRDVALRIE